MSNLKKTAIIDQRPAKRRIKPSPGSEKAPKAILQGEEILVPTFEVASNPQVSLAQLKARRFSILTRPRPGHGLFPREDEMYD